MRSIIPELPYEQPLAAGRLRYERNGAPTGSVESWRVTNAHDGYRFLRVDLDSRAAASGRSYLYHLTLNPAGRPEQLKYRLWGGGHEAGGTAVWEGDELIAARRVDGAAYEDMAAGDAFWFPAGSGLALLATCVGETRGVTLLADASDPARLMALVETPVTIRLADATKEMVGDEQSAARLLHVGWNDQQRIVWLDAESRPLRLWRGDGLTATAERLIRYS